MIAVRHCLVALRRQIVEITHLAGDMKVELQAVWILLTRPGTKDRFAEAPRWDQVMVDTNTSVGRAESASYLTSGGVALDKVLLQMHDGLGLTHNCQNTPKHQHQGHLIHISMIRYK